MLIETAVLVATVLNSVVSFLKNANAASKESKDLWSKVKGLFIIEDPNIKDLETKPEDKDTQDVISATLRKRLNEDESLKKQFIELIEKIKTNQNPNYTTNVVGNENITVVGSSSVSITTNNKKD